MAVQGFDWEAAECEERLNALRQALRSTDYQAAKLAEGWYSEEEYEPIRVQRQAWREELRTREARLQNGRGVKG